MDDPRTRARAYLAKMPGAVAGQEGHKTTFAAALALVRGFSLSEDAALDLLADDYNPRCDPPWKRSELLHKVQSAAKTSKVGTGYLLGEHKGSTPPPKAPPRPPPPPLALGGLPELPSSWPARWREAYEERAAILEHADGLTRADAERKAESRVRALHAREG